MGRGIFSLLSGPPLATTVLVRDAAGAIVGAVGITGDTSDNDEACAIAGIEAAGYTADPG